MDGIRGIHELRVPFTYPLSVLAGPNACGKSTVLFAAACAYARLDSQLPRLTPAVLFPNYCPAKGALRNTPQQACIRYEYATPDGHRAMQWGRHTKKWNRSYHGRRGGRQPQRHVYLRTLSTLSNPSEVRSILQMSRLQQLPKQHPLNPAQISLVHALLPQLHYQQVLQLSGGNKDMLFAQCQNAAYSELHMASGERVILHSALEFAQLQDALVLIDEVEAGLHPWAQQLFMLHLQQLAVRNKLQIIVTTHSPVVLYSVPPEGRIFLNRSEDDKVRVERPYRDLIQNALYGRPLDVLHILCEDKAAEAILHGILDYLVPRERLQREHLRIGRDTGAQEFPAHARALQKSGLLDQFIFVLDGAQRNSRTETELKKMERPVLLLPGDSAPERWVLQCLQQGAYACELGTDAGTLASTLQQLQSLYQAATPDAEAAKSILGELSSRFRHTPESVCRIVAAMESRDKDSEIQVVVDQLRDICRQWRSTG